MRSFLCCATAAAFVFLAGGAIAAPPPHLDAYVEKAMKAFGAPGLSLAIVENGKTVTAKGYGIRSIETGSPATAHTAFPIGSESKAFTAAALGILVDEGKLKWSDRVVDRLPGFKMYDDYATQHMTVRDLLTHRSGLGLGEGDLLIVPASSRDRASVVHALRYLKPKTGFREVFAYDNILYIVAGALVEQVSGQSWGDFVRQHIFVLLGMADAHTEYDAKAANAIALHARTNGPVRGMGDLRVLPRGLDTPAADPAGGINASAADMAKWMAMWQAGGKAANGTVVLKPETVKELWKPVVVVPRAEFAMPAPLPNPQFQDYALGWFVEDYRGHRIVQHTGAVLGALAALYFIPEKHVSFAIMINSEDSAARRALIYHLLDHYLDQPETDWIAALATVRKNMIGGALKALKNMPSDYKPNDRMSLPPAKYAGKYTDPWYGGMTVTTRPDGKLWVAFDETPGMEGPLQHVANDTFRAHWTDRGIEDAYVAFDVSKGKISSIAMKPVSPLADFSFDYQDLHFTPVY